MAKTDIINVYTLGVFQMESQAVYMTKRTEHVGKKFGVADIHHDLNEIKERLDHYISQTSKGGKRHYYIEVQQEEVYKYLDSNQVNLNEHECSLLAAKHGFAFKKFEY